MSQPVISAPEAVEASTPTPADMPKHVDAEVPNDEETPDKQLESAAKLRDKLREENRALKERLKETEPLAKKAQEAEDAKKSEVQKAVERAEAAERRDAEKDALLTRLDLAVQYNIPRDDIGLIGSGTREEMDTNAKRLAALHAAASKASPPPTDRPVEGLRPGATPEPPKPADDSYPSQWTPSYVKNQDPRSQHGQ